MASAVENQPQSPPQTGARQSRPLAALDHYFAGVHGKAEFVNPDNLPTTVYKRMFETDETVQAAIEFIQLTTFAQLGSYEHPNARVTTYLKEFWERCATPFEDAVRETLDALWAGFAVQERVLDYQDGKLWLAEFPALDQVDVRFFLDTGEGSKTKGRVVGVSQDYSLFSAALTKSPGEPAISAERLAIFTHRGRNGNLYGMSRCKGVYKHWVQKDVLTHAGGAGMERYGVPLAIGFCASPNNPVQDADGARTTQGKQMLKALQQLAALGVIVLQKDQEDVRIVTPGDGIAAQFKIAVDQANKLIMRGMLLPSLMMEPTDIGSFALGSKHFELFLKGIRRLVLDLRRFYHTQVYAPLIGYNFGAAQAKLGRWVAQEMDEEDLSIWSDIFYKAFTTGFLRPDAELDDANLCRKIIPGAKDWTKLPPAKTGPAGAPTSGVTDPNPQAPADAKPGVPRPGAKVPKGPQGRPGGKK